MAKKDLSKPPLDPNDAKPSAKGNIWHDIWNSLASEIVSTLFIAIPFGLVAWLFIAWGSIWLILPMVMVIGFVILWLTRRK